MENKQDLTNFLKYAYEMHYNKKKKWTELSDEYNKKFNENTNDDIIRKRCKRFIKSFSVPKHVNEEKNNNINNDSINTSQSKEWTTYSDDGTIDAQCIVKYSSKVFGDKIAMLKYLGYSPKEWEFSYFTTSRWNQSSKKSGTKDLYAVKYKLKPLNGFKSSDAIKVAKEVFSKEIRPIKVPMLENRKDFKYYNDKLMEIPGIELHLGKLSNEIETGENYDYKIASLKFNNIFIKIIEKQEIEKCRKCLILIGNDFFNSESDNMTTGKTPQQNDTRYKKLFKIGLELYIKAISTLQVYFEDIDVMLCQGNHARAMEYFLYVALQQYFLNYNSIHFNDNVKETQCYVYGDCALFFNHGDSDLKRTISSIPAEFYEEWGKTKYRELHLGHLHKEFTVDDNSGLITRRIGSPTNIDEWHYQNRFIGAVKKHQIFIWNNKTGLENIYYINCN